MSSSLIRACLDACPLPRGANPAGWKRWSEKTQRFLSRRFLQSDIDDLVRARAALVDRMLRALWSAGGMDEESDLALLAVGGYGRGELHPQSDIDILALYRGRAAPRALGPFFQTLWDSGLRLSQSARTVRQCRDDARADITLMTSWLEVRPLRGDLRLARELEDNLIPRTGLLQAPLWTPERFFEGKVEERKTRHQRFGGDSYQLEPNIKEGPGGLRDIQTLDWILRRRPDIASPSEFCEPRELDLLREGKRFLWRTRFALHEASGQAEERLLFDYQHTVAKRLGYRGDTVNDMIEAFMRDFYRSTSEVDRLAEVLIQQYRESLRPPSHRAPRSLSACFQERDGYLEIRDDDVFKRHPQGLLELFLLLQRHPEIQGARARVIRAVRANLHRIDDAFRARPANQDLFLDILRQPWHIAREFRRMHRYGVLARYWPDFGRTVGMMQYDLFHIHPVDEHTLQVLTELRRLAKPPRKGENPLYHELFRQFPKPELLYLAALFHDIGKGRGGDHSEIGGTLAQDFCREHRLSAYDSGMVRWLVERHLMMSMTSQKRDIGDPDVAREFAARVGNGIRLRGLFLLTVADLRGTNPALWTPWREALLRQLYDAADRQLRRGLDQPLDAAQLIRELKTSALEKILVCSESDCLRFWSSLRDGDLLHYTDDDLAWQTERVLTRAPDIPTQAFARHQGEHHCTEILIHDESHAPMFASITAALARLSLNVLYARVTETRERHILQTFLVTDTEGMPIHNRRALDELLETLRGVIRSPKDFDRPVLRRPKRRTRHFDLPTEIEFACHENPTETRIHLSASDHPGLLWTVSRALDQCQARITRARITTLGAQARDVFTVTDMESRPILDPKAQHRIVNAMRERIERLGATARE